MSTLTRAHSTKATIFNLTFALGTSCVVGSCALASGLDEFTVSTDIANGGNGGGGAAAQAAAQAAAHPAA